MKKTEARFFYGFLTDSKPLLIASFLVMAVCFSWYFVDTSYASSDSRDQWQTVKMRVTAYCPCPKCCGSYSDGVTACGHKISQGDRFVAADKIYPFGTEMIIPGYNSTEAVKVVDRGGAIRGNRLDVFFNTHQEALEWGVRHLDVKIRYQ